MGRDVTADATPLLKNAEQNIGNSATINPQAGAPTVIPQTNPARILDLSGGSASGQTVSVIFTASRISQGQQNPYPGFPGPITGVLEFGNGGRFTRVEFDVPVGPFDGYITKASMAVEPQDGGVIVTVPSGLLRAYCRYDNLLLAPLINFDPPISHAEASGVDIVGPGGPLYITNPVPPPPPASPNTLIPAEPVLAKAMAAYFQKSRSRVWKTLNCYVTYETATGAPDHAPQFITVGQGPGFTANPYAYTAAFPNYAWWALPAFTKRVKVLRFPDTTGLAVLLHDGIRPVDFINIPSGPTAPEIEIEGNVNIIGITSGSGQVSLLKIVCEIGI